MKTDQEDLCLLAMASERDRVWPSIHWTWDGLLAAQHGLSYASLLGARYPLVCSNVVFITFWAANLLSFVAYVRFDALSGMQNAGDKLLDLAPGMTQIIETSALSEYITDIYRIVD